MNLDLGKFKKLSEDSSSATLRHPAGHEIKIAKRHLNKRTLQDLSSLPMHYANAGEVEDPNQPKTDDVSTDNTKTPTINIYNGQQPQGIQQPAPQQAPSPEDLIANSEDIGSYGNRLRPSVANPMQTKIDALKERGDLQKQAADRAAGDTTKKAAQVDEYNKLAQAQGLPALPGGTPAPQPEAQPNLETSNLAPTAPAPNQDPYGSQAYSDQYMKGLNEQESGIRGEANTLSDLGNQQAQTYQAAIEQQQQQAKSYQDHQSALWQERDNFMKDYQNQKIDPNHYMNSLGTGQKIAAGIGLILGGMGGGLTHSDNPMEKFIDNQISNDIKSQEANMGKTKNLLAANFESFGNLRDAAQMTRVMQSDIVAHQIAMQAAKSQDPIVHARAQQSIGILHQQSAAIISQLAMKKTLQSSMQSGGIPPAQAINMIVPKEQQAEAIKELKDVSTGNSMLQNYLQSFDDIHSKVANGVFSPVDYDSARNAFIGKIVREGEGRFNLEAATMLADSIFPPKNSIKRTFESEETAKKQRMRGVELINSFFQAPVLESYGLRPQSSGLYNSSGEKKPEFKLNPPVGKTAKK